MQKRKEIIVFVIIVTLSSCTTVSDVIANINPKKNNETEDVNEQTRTKKTTLIEIQKRPDWDNDKVNTVKYEAYLSVVEKNIIIELNKVRINPSKYSRLYLVPMRSLYTGNFLKYPGEIPIRTGEGLSALNECIAVLENTTPMGLLSSKEGLYFAAKDHLKDQSKSGDVVHFGSDNSSPGDRIERYGKWEITAAENISYGKDNARRIVVSLLIDDRVPSRGHRENILNPEFKVIGVAHGMHLRYETMTVMDFAGEFLNK